MSILEDRPDCNSMDEFTKATIILAEDHPLFMKGLIAVLKKDFLILGVATNGQELIEMLKAQQPQLVISDLQMPYMDGLSAAKQIAIYHPQIKIIILSAFYDLELENKLREVGVKGYLTKDVDSKFLINQIKQVLGGRAVFCEPEEYARFNINNSSNSSLNQYKLSSRELEIISLVRKGLTSEEIAKGLFISINTVEAHRKHILKKLKLKNIQGLVEFACKYSL